MIVGRFIFVLVAAEVQTASWEVVEFFAVASLHLVVDLRHSSSCQVCPAVSRETSRGQEVTSLHVFSLWGLA